MKGYEVTISFDYGEATIEVQAEDYDSAVNRAHEELMYAVTNCSKVQEVRGPYES